MNHTELQSDVVTLCSYTGWSHLHVRRSIGRGKKWVTSTNVVGWPDLLLWSMRQPGRHLAVELKVPPDKLSDDQHETLNELAAAGFECYVVVPKRSDIDRIETSPHVIVVELVDLPHILRPSRQAR